MGKINTVTIGLIHRGIGNHFYPQLVQCNYPLRFRYILHGCTSHGYVGDETHVTTYRCRLFGNK